MAQLFARDNTAFLTNYIETYGPVAKIHGFFGASCRLYSKNYSPRPDHRRPALQARFIHTYDPKALHSVHVKDQESYDRGPQTILYVHASYNWMLQRCLTTSPSLFLTAPPVCSSGPACLQLLDRSTGGSANFSTPRSPAPTCEACLRYFTASLARCAGALFSLHFTSV